MSDATPNRPEPTKNPVIPLESLRSQVGGLSLEAFVERYPHPFLVLEAKESDAGAAGFQTLAKRPDSKAHEPDESSEGPVAEPELGESADPIEKTEYFRDPDSEPPTKPASPKKEEAPLATYVCPLVKSHENKFASMITVGRAANNDIRLKLASVSKFHAYFTHVQSNNTWYVGDANSSNGTFVNGERLKTEKNRTRLENGAAVRIGPDVAARFFDARSFFEFLHGSDSRR